MSTSQDRIEKTVLLRAPLPRVWRAISDSKEFGSWFGVDFDAPFAPGRAMTGAIVPTTVDPEVAKMQEPHRGARFEVLIDRIEPPTHFSFRWHPFAVDKGVDYTKEPMTLVTFTLAEVEGGTLLTIVESGFDALPLPRRTQAFTSNDGGWQAQTGLVAKYVARAVA